jgi:DNA helicase HerA-like ATPase
MFYDGKILIGKSGDEDIYIYPKMANRHGLIAGATGTGKTVSLKVMAESFSDIGVPVFLADVKGDLSGMCQAGVEGGSALERVQKFNLFERGFNFKSFPSNYWDVYAEKGMPLRTTVSEMGPLLLARILELNDTQTDILTVIFKIADDEGLLLIDTKDLRAMLQFVSEHAKDYSRQYGNMSATSIAAIMRAVIALETEGGEVFVGEPALNIRDWIATDYNGKGMIQILDCQKLILHPKMYSTFLLWLMSELYETLPEVGDLDRPRMVFFFDEAHMLFNSASKALLEKIEQVVKLIRSKGVGIYFITQNPKDIPDGVLAQLGNKIQHALRAYTPADQKGLKAAASSFRENPEFDTLQTLQELGTGEALVSVLDEKGIPTIVKRTKILPPQSYMGMIDDGERQRQINSCTLFTKYQETYDRDSAYEFFQRLNIEQQEAFEAAALEAQRAKEEALAQKQAEKEELLRQKEEEKAAKEQARLEEKEAREQQREEERQARERAKLEEKYRKEQEKAQEKLLKEQQKAQEKALKEAQKEKERQERAVRNAIKGTASAATGTIGREVGKSLGSSFGSFGKTLGGNVGASLGRGIIGTLFAKK